MFQTIYVHILIVDLNLDGGQALRLQQSDSLLREYVLKFFPANVFVEFLKLNIMSHRSYNSNYKNKSILIYASLIFIEKLIL